MLRDITRLGFLPLDWVSAGQAHSAHRFAARSGSSELRDSLLKHSFGEVALTQTIVRGDIVGIDLQRLPALLDRLVVLASVIEYPSCRDVDVERERIELLGTAYLPYGLIRTTDRGQIQGVQAVRLCPAGV